MPLSQRFSSRLILPRLLESSNLHFFQSTNQQVAFLIDFNVCFQMSRFCLVHLAPQKRFTMWLERVWRLGTNEECIGYSLFWGIDESHSGYASEASQILTLDRHFVGRSHRYKFALISFQLARPAYNQETISICLDRRRRSTCSY